MAERSFVNSLEEIQRINIRLGQIKDDASNTTSSAVSSINELKSTIRGNGVDETLQLLSEALNANKEKIDEIIQKMQGFVRKQMIAYQQADKTVNTELNAAEDIINGIKIRGGNNE